MSLFGKDKKKGSDKMRTFEVKLAGKRPAAKSAKKAKPKGFGFTEWIEQYVKASKGNVV